jgi:DDE superfamily endonuclease
MNTQLLDVYCDYLLSSFGQTTATGLSTLVGGSISHDAITRMLSSERQTSKDLWHLVKPLVRAMESPDGVMIVDDSIEEKPYTDENDIVCWHYDHCVGRSLKGINFVTTLYYSQDQALPVAFELVAKTETYIDKKTQKEKRRSPISKNTYCQQMLQKAVENQIPFRYVLSDVWFASAETIKFVKNDLKKDVVMPLKTNRHVALSYADKHNGLYVRVDTLQWEENVPREIYLEGIDFPLLLVRQVFTNDDGSTGILYLIASDTTMTYDQITTTYQKRWRVEVYHKSIKQNASLSKSPTHTVTTQANHFFAALCAYSKLEMLATSKKLNHTALKTKLYISALQQAFKELQSLQPLQFSLQADCVR